MKIRSLKPDPPGGSRYAFFCPGCQCAHWFQIGDVSPRWEFNGDKTDKPTVSPSILVDKDNPAGRCHLFLRAGRIEFLSDCFHDLAGKTVDVPEFD